MEAIKSYSKKKLWTGRIKRELKLRAVCLGRLEGLLKLVYGDIFHRTLQLF